MSDLRPFRALRYDTDRVTLSDVVVPPYDVIALDERAALYDLDPHSALRLELTRDVADQADTNYRHVSEMLRNWQREGVLVRRGDLCAELFADRHAHEYSDAFIRRHSQLWSLGQHSAEQDAHFFLPTSHQNQAGYHSSP